MNYKAMNRTVDFYRNLINENGIKPEGTWGFRLVGVDEGLGGI